MSDLNTEPSCINIYVMKRKEKNHKKYILAPVIILMYSNKCKCTYVKTKIGKLSNIQCMYGKVKRTLRPSIDLNNY